MIEIAHFSKLKIISIMMVFISISVIGTVYAALSMLRYLEVFSHGPQILTPPSLDAIALVVGICCSIYFGTILFLIAKRKFVALFIKGNSVVYGMRVGTICKENEVVDVIYNKGSSRIDIRTSSGKKIGISLIPIRESGEYIRNKMIGGGVF